MIISERLYVKKIKNIILWSAISLFFVIAGCNSDSGKLFGHGKVTSLEEAGKYAPGVWTANMVERGAGIWYKYVIKEDGTGETYWSMADDDTWLNKTPMLWKAGTGKYTDSGERYFDICITETNSATSSRNSDYCGHKVVFMDRDSVAEKMFLHGESPVVFARGDKFPFSK